MRYAFTNTDRNRYCDGNGYSYRHGNSYSYRHGITFRDSDSYGYVYTQADAYPEIRPDTEAPSHTGAEAIEIFAMRKF